MTLSFPHSLNCYSLCPKLELNPTFDAGPNSFSLAVIKLQLSLVSLDVQYVILLVAVS